MYTGCRPNSGYASPHKDSTVNILMIPNPTVLGHLSEEHRTAILDAAGPGSRIEVCRTLEEQLRFAPEADVAFGLIPREVFVAMPKLRYVQSLSAGIDAMMYPEFVESPVPLVSEKGIVGNQLAEHAFGMLLAFTRKIKDLVGQQQWVEDRAAFRSDMWELAGMTMGVVGLGGTGNAVARRAEAFGMRVVAVDVEEVPKPPYVAELWHASRLDELLAESDVVVCCLPLTNETRRLFDYDRFTRFKRGSIFINVTRGEIVDEDGIVRALREGILHSAGLDVTPREPLPPDSELWRLPNVIVGCHTAGGSPHRGQRAVDRFCANLRRLRNGEPLEGLIDKRKGY